MEKTFLYELGMAFLMSLSQLAENGNAEAMLLLGINWLLEGDVEGVRDAAKCFMKAAENGHLLGQTLLAAYYNLVGRRDEAIRLLADAAKKGEPTAKDVLAELYRDIAEDECEENLIRCYTLAASLGECQAQNHLAICSMDSNPTKVKELLKSSAKQGYVLALLNLGALYAEGSKGFHKDYRLAVKYLRDAARQNSAEACFILGEIYKRGGHGVHKNVDRAYRYYSCASQFAHPEYRPYTDYARNIVEGVIGMTNLKDAASFMMSMLDSLLL